MFSVRDRAAIAGIGSAGFGINDPQVSPLVPLAMALKNAIADAGLRKEDIDGLLVNIGTPSGVDYDQVAEAFDLRLHFCDQTWTHGRQMATVLSHAAMAVSAGLANYVACVCSINWARRGTVGGVGQAQDDREVGGSHYETPYLGMTSPGGAAALSVQRYFALYGASSDDLAQVAITIRGHAALNPAALRREPLTLDAYRKARFICEPLRLFDYCQTRGGACVVIVTTSERAADCRSKPVFISGLQGMSAGRQEATGGRPGLGLHQQAPVDNLPLKADLAIYERAGVDRAEIAGFYTYDAMTPYVWMALERFGFCEPGEAWRFVNEGNIRLGGKLPVNTNGGLLSEAHISGWNHVCEMVRQLRGECGERQIEDAHCLQWGTLRGDSVILRN